MDLVGNIYRTPEKTDRKYGPGGRLLEADGTTFEYDADGNRISQRASQRAHRRFDWNSECQLTGSHEGPTTLFFYDAFGRRTTTRTATSQQVTWSEEGFWDGDVPLHKRGFVQGAPMNPPDSHERQVSRASPHIPDESPARRADPEVLTWIFEPDTFTSVGRLSSHQSEEVTIAADYLGTPVIGFDAVGNPSWFAELDILGQVRVHNGDRMFCPFRYPGQCEDADTGLYYNRFRYYDPFAGQYISQDPLRLDAGFKLYGYSLDPLCGIDPLGLIIVYHYTSDAGASGIQNSGRSGSWNFRASQPPGGHPFGFYVTSKFDPSQTSELHRMGIPADKRTHWFAIEVDDAKFKELFEPLPGGRGATGVSLYHPKDMDVPKVYQNEWMNKKNRQSRTVRQVGCGKV